MAIRVCMANCTSVVYGLFFCTFAFFCTFRVRVCLLSKLRSKSVFAARKNASRSFMPRWKAQSLALQGLLAFENLSGQRYDLSSYANNDKSEGTVLNYSELLGQALYLRAAGSFRPASGGRPSPLRCPVDSPALLPSQFDFLSIFLIIHGDLTFLQRFALLRGGGAYDVEL